MLPTASFSLIKVSFHRLARLRHPDKVHSTLNDDPGFSVPSFIEVQNAWGVLRDPARRSKYDDTLHVKKYFKSLDQHNVVRLSDMECELCIIDSNPFDVEDRSSTITHNGVNENAVEESCEDYVYSYECACGDVFEIIRSDLIESTRSEQEYTSMCGSCSCRICVLDDIGVHS